MLKVNSVGLFAISRQISKLKRSNKDVFDIARYAEKHRTNDMTFTLPHNSGSVRVVLDKQKHFEVVPDET